MLKYIKILVALVVAIFITSLVFGVVVPPGSVGVRQIAFGPGQGFSDEGLLPGYHWSIPIYSKVHVIPQTIEPLHMLREGEGGRSKLFGPVEIQTTDGSSVVVDFSILTKFFSSSDKDHGGPADLLKQLGANRTTWMETVRRVATDELKRSMARLSTGEFYNPVRREEEIAVAQVAINNRLKEFGIGVIAVLLRRYTYAEERIDSAIFEKNLQDQEERLNAAASILAEAKAASEAVEAELDARITTLKVEGENKVRVIRSEGDLYEADKVAQGDLAVAKAMAEVDSLKAGVLARSAGAEAYVARELAPLMSSLKGGVVSDVDPYNLDGWLNKFGAKGR